TLPTGLSQADMRAIIQNARQKELAFEGHRFFDVRRWKIAETMENRQLHGTEPVRVAGVTTYNTIDVRKRVFNQRMYLWPIPQSEVAKSVDLLQNPGYKRKGRVETQALFTIVLRGFCFFFSAPFGGGYAKNCSGWAR